MQVNVFEAKSNLSKLLKLLKDGKEDYIVIANHGKPCARLVLDNGIDASKRLGAAKGMFKFPDNFDDIDISEDFEGEIFPKWNTY